MVKCIHGHHPADRLDISHLVVASAIMTKLALGALKPLDARLASARPATKDFLVHHIPRERRRADLALGQELHQARGRLR
jgi:hypothetical protein